jgi:formate dehydrogenase iron-sulfur subunit
MTTVRISDDALALACGADVVAAAFVAAGCTVERVSSWGMHWLEPLVEIDGHRLGSGLAGAWRRCSPGKADDLCIGPDRRDHPFIAGQQRLTFARAGATRPLSLDDYAATGGWQG